MNLSPEFDLKKFRNVFELDRFPDIPWHDIRHFLSDFIGYFSNMFNTIDDIPNKFRREIFKTYAENYKVLKYFELDDEVTTNLLPIFS